MSSGALLERLEVLVPGGVRSRAIDRLAFAHDASHYLLTPTAIVAPANVGQVSALLRASTELGTTLTFRSGGTSLSGQASSDGVLVDSRRHFKTIEVLEDGRRVRVQPGATVRQVNARLHRFGTKLGPDPASEVACTIGGIVANNSSGMACGTAENAYSTIESAVLVLPRGTVVDTAEAEADALLRLKEPHLWEGLGRLRDRVRRNPSSVASIERQFSIKNTMGYGLNSFIDHERPIDILLHLAVGSEGTLAFVAEATFRTIPIKPAVATGLLVFPTLAHSTAALPSVVATGPAIVELLDAASLRVAQRDPVADARLRAIAVDGHAALLVEYQEADATDLIARLDATVGTMSRIGFSVASEFKSDPSSRADLWHIRKGLYAAVAGSRPPGTTALLEDIAVPVSNLLPTCNGLVRLFDEFEYEDSVIFGHAKDGNIHFLLNERFDETGSPERYLAFTERMVDLVLGQNGTLKAEHGTGRVMAPFVRRQYGDELYEVMQELKRLCDPGQVLNAGVLLNEDPVAHVSNLKTSPTVEVEVDRCVECGYCEPACPSRDLTTTPRQRIVLRRELERARNAGDHAIVRELEKAYEYDAIDTCATDGMCATACPVRIDTGQLVKRLRSERNDGMPGLVWNRLARRWGLASRAAATGLSLAHVLPSPVVIGATRAARAVLGAEHVPLWQGELPSGGPPRRGRDVTGADVVYMPACVGSIFGPVKGSPGVQTAFLALCRRAGVEVRIPDRIADLCCGTPWASKGYAAGYETIRQRTVADLWEATEHARIPVVCDASSCTEGLIRQVAQTHPGIAVVDAVSFVEERVLPRVSVSERVQSLALHPTCSSTHLGINGALRRVGEALADRVDVPIDWGCCGFAGDRGMLHPELAASATAAEAAAVEAGGPYHRYASVNRTCELAMTQATGRDYRHVLELLEEATR